MKPTRPITDPTVKLARLTSETLQQGQNPSWQPDAIAVEEPLQIRLNWPQDNSEVLAVTLRTPGHDEELIIGLLYAEGLIHSFDDVAAISLESDENQSFSNQWQVDLKKAPDINIQTLSRHLMVNSACGLCGKTTLQALEMKNPPEVEKHSGITSSSVILGLNHTVKQTQEGYRNTGGIHASALFATDGTLIAIREDIGRHNALDKLVGFQLKQGNLPAKDRILWVSGRASFELVQKAVMAGFPILASVGAPSSLAIQTAVRFGITLIGFLREGRFNIYHGEWRLNQ